MSTILKTPYEHHSGEISLKYSASKTSSVSWTVRPATVDDLDQLQNMLYVCYSTLLTQHYDKDVLLKAMPILTRPRMDLLTCGTWYVVEHPLNKKEIIGCGGWTRHAPGCGTSVDKNCTENINTTTTTTGRSLPSQPLSPPHLRHFAVSPQWTKQGVAKALWLKTWQDICEQMGPSTPLEVYSTLFAVGFYASLGFVPVDLVEIPLTSSCIFSTLLMRREGEKY